jgi:hypothetical protein
MGPQCRKQIEMRRPQFIESSQRPARCARPLPKSLPRFSAWLSWLRGVLACSPYARDARAESLRNCPPGISSFPKFAWLVTTKHRVGTTNRLS